MSANTPDVTVRNFKTEVFESELPVVLDLWAPWCQPCRMLSPLLEKMAAQFRGKVKVHKLNVDEEQGLARSLGVQGIPTLLFIKDGRIHRRHVGLPTPAALKQLFRELATPEAA